MSNTSKLIWIDLDNSPHVPFFKPIVEQLRARGYHLTLTARDAFQVTDLTRLHAMPCITVGRHFGKNKVMKVCGLLIRTLQLLPLVWRQRPALAVSHGSRTQMLAARLLGIPCIVIADYEHVTHVNSADYMLVPEIVAASVGKPQARHLLQYPGIKEDVYAANFKPDDGLFSQLSMAVPKADDILVTVRPPATEAHYHNPASDTLFDAVIELLAHSNSTRIVLLPRNDRQARDITQRWPHLLAQGKIVLPHQAVDGLNLVWHSDLVISGGGTMNREAAALGVPVYSIFKGPIGAVDRYLADHGRLVLINDSADAAARIVLEKRRHDYPTPQTRCHHPTPRPSALTSIVDQIARVAQGT